MSLKREKPSENREVASIRNDYVRSVERKEKRHQAHKVRLFRRLSVFGILVLMASIWIGTTIYAQSQTISEKEQMRAETLASLEKAEKEQKKLEEQILLLNDDEYIAKLARKEYFLSEDGEIIFTLPNEDQKTKEKADEKE
ncbi:septum formation initiator family protein [Planococcus sp. NCCP-2050]|uniref:FtsB family cell division protein n=1 Tax=Planococcus sp. NCCP-2050 TaxID=2944679 RepID=UPI0020404250|nr:septum formation initiator family protein [Planococcus sp. NCCP-2050]GKW47690.1 cell division protein DivIC [Planococcus sp. NCCP-2050]